MKKISELPTCSEIKKGLHINANQSKIVADSKSIISDIITGKSDKKLLILGPCSIDFNESVLEYARNIKTLSDKVQDKIHIVMRCYSAKPRTIVGWKGMLYNGEFGSKGDINTGIPTVRKLMLDILDIGLPIADEMLYPDLLCYFDDLVSYYALGARSVEDQLHREVASGLDIPVGIKNPTSGDLNITANTLACVRAPHQIILNGNYYTSEGNHLAHIILRGSNWSGESVSNIEDIPDLLDILNDRGLESKILVDLNHDNSGKDALMQPRNMQKVLDQKSDKVIGFMVESYLKDGAQKPSERHVDIMEKGKSITDSCLGIQRTQEMVMDLYKSL